MGSRQRDDVDSSFLPVITNYANRWHFNTSPTSATPTLGKLIKKNNKQMGLGVKCDSEFLK